MTAAAAPKAILPELAVPAAEAAEAEAPGAEAGAGAALAAGDAPTATEGPRGAARTGQSALPPRALHPGVDPKVNEKMGLPPGDPLGGPPHLALRAMSPRTPISSPRLDPPRSTAPCPHAGRPASASVYVANLDSRVDDAALLATFCLFGGIESCRVVTDEAGDSCGHGYVHYQREDGAKVAIERMSGMKIGSKKVSVSRLAWPTLGAQEATCWRGAAACREAAPAAPGGARDPAPAEAAPAAAAKDSAQAPTEANLAEHAAPAAEAEAARPGAEASAADGRDLRLLRRLNKNLKLYKLLSAVSAMGRGAKASAARLEAAQEQLAARKAELGRLRRQLALQRGEGLQAAAEPTENGSAPCDAADELEAAREGPDAGEGAGATGRGAGGSDGRSGWAGLPEAALQDELDETSDGDTDDLDSDSSLDRDIAAMERPPPETVDMLSAVVRGELGPVLQWLADADRSARAFGHGHLAARVAARQGHRELSAVLAAALDTWAPLAAGQEPGGSDGGGSHGETSL